MEKLKDTASRKIVYLLITLILIGTIGIAKGSTYFSIEAQALALASSPLVILQNITNSQVLTGNTSAIVSVSNGTNNLDVLQVLNQTNDAWQLQMTKYSDDNINRLTNCTIWLNNGSAPNTQIQVIDGEYTQVSGDYYTLEGNGADSIALTVTTNATGTTYIYTYLKILTPNTSTYSLYAITFEII